jgi:general L-amino acid transport system permease protein
VLVVVVALVVALLENVRANSEDLGIPTGYGYLDNPAQFPIPDSSFRQTQPVRDAIALGFLNTLRVTVVGIVLATVLGTVIGICRLSGNWLVRNLARLYVETLRNVPLLLIIVFSYLGLALTAFPRIDEAWQPFDLAVVSNRGVVVPWFDGNPWGLLLGIAVTVATAGLVARWRTAVQDRRGVPGRAAWWVFGVIVVGLACAWLLAGNEVTVPEVDGRVVTGGIRLSPEYFAILFALVIYTASHIAEIVRGSIQAVHRGQTEAALSLGLTSAQRMRLVILPQAARIAVPPLGNQYLNLAKNSTLGAVVSYYELALVTSISVGNGAPAVPSYALTLAIFVALSLVLSLLVNVVNRRLALVER